MILFRGMRTILESTKERETLRDSCVGPLFSIGNRRRSARDARPVREIKCLQSLLLLIVDTVRDQDMVRVYTLAVEELAKSYTAVLGASELPAVVRYPTYSSGYMLCLMSTWNCLINEVQKL